MLSKLPETVIETDKQIAFNLADLCYNIGQWALSESQFGLASKWLEKASKVISVSLDSCEQIDPDRNKLRLVIFHALGEIFLCDLM
jgi:Meiosis protein SPO22/ZIP4 like